MPKLIETPILKVLPCGCKILATPTMDIEYCDECWKELLTANFMIWESPAVSKE